MNLLAESFAGNIDAANRWKFLVAPFREAAIQDRDILVTEFGEGRRGECCPTFAFVVNDDGNPPVRNQFGDAKFYLASGQRSRVGNLAKVKLSSLADIEYGMRGFGSH